jgi:putative flippase GtrA
MYSVITDDVALPRVIGRLAADRRIRYLATGAVSAAVFYGTFAGLWLVAKSWLPYLAAVLIGNVVTALVTYPVFRLVFDASGRWVSGFFRFYLVTLWGLAFNLLGLPFLVEVVHLNVLLAEAIVILANPLINYQIHRYWTFRPRR